MSIECKHGYLARACDRCEMEQEIAELREALGRTPTIDSNVSAVRRKLAERAEFGLSKYGVTTERTDLTTLQWLQHLQDELMDGAVYAERLMKCDEIDALKHDIERQQTACSEHLGEVEKLRAFVRAWDAYRVARKKFQQSFAAYSSDFDAAYAAMLAAREAVGAIEP